ncbi:helix-turn-helix domain-containing protein [Pantanalinema sp. GBBB05]|uniref:helix-turn-helix domain-containing protein n=1 Tax=Pantanalinema sp. GBBB05 TaxID=2604139 RepID=UPI001DD43AB5|nr:helix-turn-helix transcriptional regulator [Pantanalinema sp. GBBB05]
MLLQQNSLVVKQPVVGHLVQELRQALGLTQKKFAAQLGVTFPTLNRWENGHATPSPLALKQIEMLLNQLSESSDVALRERSQTIQKKYFQSEEPEA